MTTSHGELSPLPEAGESLLVNLDGYSGPLDLLLDLARNQKVDLRDISMVQLVDQYLAFLDAVKDSHIEIAAEYLVMAAWLLLLKSRTMLPEDHSESQETTEEAEYLAFQIKRLEALRDCAAKLEARPQLGRDFFARGDPELTSIVHRRQPSMTLYMLLQTYLHVRSRDNLQPITDVRRGVVTVKMAEAFLQRFTLHQASWTDLYSMLPPEWLTDRFCRKGAMAATLVASLEMARTGHLELQQETHMAPIMVRRKKVLEAQEHACRH